MRVGDVLQRLRSLGDPAVAAGLARFGIETRKAYGLTTPQLRQVAKELPRDHRLAQELWATGVHEARVLAAMIDEAEKVTVGQMDRWARDFDNWAVCDACCQELFVRTPFAHGRVQAWSKRKEEFVKRAAFALMAELATHDKASPDAAFLRLLPVIEREAEDERNFVKKALSWALRQIGKRNAPLRKAALETAERLAARESKAAQWLAADVLKELKAADGPAKPAAAPRAAARPAARPPAKPAAKTAARRRR
jgi:3-methyladenine DNA glycosylase AlkD